jgi:hypothetical protein
MALMRVTPVLFSGYYWLTILAFFVTYTTMLLICEPTTFLQRVVIWIPNFVAYMWLAGLARKAQFEADWALPKHPRIPVTE